MIATLDRRVLCSVVDDASRRRIICRGCGALLAMWTPSGRRVVILMSAVRSVERDEFDRIEMDCLACGKRRRVPKGGDA